MHFHSCCTSIWTLSYISQDTYFHKAYCNAGIQKISQSLCCMQKEDNSYLDVLIESFVGFCSFHLWRIDHMTRAADSTPNPETGIGRRVPRSFLALAPAAFLHRVGSDGPIQTLPQSGVAGRWDLSLKTEAGCYSCRLKIATFFLAASVLAVKW